MEKRQHRTFGLFNKRMLCLVMSLVLITATAVALTGCGQRQQEVQRVEKALKLYYVNSQFVETGDESQGTLVEYDGISIYLPEETPDGMSSADVTSRSYTDAVIQLWEVPKDLTNAVTMVTERYGLNDITVKDGTAYVDLKGKDLQEGSGGSLEELCFISQIVETLTNSFDEIDQVQFLVDGQEAETLLGHCDVSEPLSDSLLESAAADTIQE
ncbi:hypothetical protein Ami103574_02330 [Aminipila butyrica]|uniref:GerMN domain-containing protein n=1 Tax=Aminipila butyrica TaxID=433296 RepID=A0A858BRN9_9FIRM|nr:GerMN domain-containing protein [Aminipila butyrica]QIB68217.1 hypothetical protein Ami103574_02330 [Aminipila butyrica]